MMRLLLLLDLEQLTCIESNYPHLLADGTIIIALDLDVSARLHGLHISHLEIPDFISVEEIKAIHEFNLKLIDTWFEPIEAHFKYEKISPLRLERLVMAWAFPQMLLAKQLMDRILERYDAAQVMFFECRDQPGEGAAITKDTFAAVWTYELEQKNVRYTLLHQPATQSAGSAYLTKIYRVIVSSLKNPLFWKVWRCNRKAGTQSHLFFSILSLEAYRFSEIARRLRMLFKERVVLMTCGARSVGSIVISDDLIYHSIPFLPGWHYLKLRRMAKQWFKQWQSIRKKIDHHPEIFHNPHLDYQFRYLFEERVPNVIQTYREAKCIFSAYNAQGLLTSSISTLYSSGVVQAARDLDLPVITIPHSGIISYVEFQTPGDITLSWTQDAAQVWKKRRSVTSRVIGMPESLISRGIQQKQNTASIPGDVKQITLLLASPQESGMPYLDLKRHRQTMEAILNVPEELRTRVKIIIKLHPANDYSYFYDWLIERAQAQSYVQVIREMALEQLILQSDVALLVNIPTSAYLLPLLQGAPELFIHTAGYVAQPVTYAEWGGQAVITEMDDIWPRLRGVLFDNAVRETILRDNQIYLHHLVGDDPDPIATICELMSNLIS